MLLSKSPHKLYAINKTSLTGKGACVAILDTGIYPHKDLRNNIAYFQDFVDNRYAAYDDNSHGTHVAGIIAGKSYGIAPKASLISLKILQKNGLGRKDAMSKALYWLLSNYEKYSITIINISVGSDTASCYEEKNEISDLLSELWHIGISIVVSAGNSGPGRSTITFPGTCENVITVGCVEKNSPASGEGPTKCNISKPDLVAYGSNILSCDSNGGYTVKSGTSMSTPMVSGAICLINEKNQNLSNAEIKALLKKTAVDLGLPGRRQGAGMLNILGALQSVP